MKRPRPHRIGPPSRRLAVRKAAKLRGGDPAHTLLENISVGAVLLGPRAEILLANRRALTLLGLTHDQLVGRTTLDPDWDVVDVDGNPLPGPARPGPRAIAERRPVRGVHLGIYRPTTRDRAWLLVDADPQLDPAGKVTQVVCTLTEVTASREAEARLRVVIESLGDSLFVHDLEGRILDCNRWACESLGYSREELLARSIGDVDRQQTRQTLLGRLGRDRVTGALTGEGLHCRKDGSTFPVEVRVAGLRRGSDPLFVSTARDISERKRAEESLHRSERRYRALFEDSLGFVSTHDEKGVFLAVNPAAAEGLGYRASEIVGRTMTDFLAPEVRDRFPAYLSEILTRERASGLMKILRPDGERRIWRYRNALQREEGTAPYVIGFAQDVTELMALARDKARMALTDPLTGLGNRRAGEEAIAREVARARRLKTPLSFLLIDIDHFKAVNDARGHAGGDDVLCALARCLQASFRTSDTLVRWGGEEFLGILAANPYEGALFFADRVRENVETLALPAAPGLTVSVGVAQLEANEEPMVTLARADAALYRAKAEGRNRVR